MNTHNSRFRLPFVLGLVFMALLTACGGGDDAVARADKFTVGVLNSAPYMSVMVVNFQAGLAQMGYIEGQNVTYIYDADVTPDTLSEAAEALVKADVDIIMATGVEETLAAQAVAGDIPIIFGSSNDPVADGLVEDLRNPGKHTTGVRSGGFNQRRLQLLAELNPTEIRKIYVLYSPFADDPGEMRAELGAVASSLGVDLIMAEVTHPQSLQEAIQSMPEDTDALFIGSYSVLAYEEAVMQAAIEHKLPTSTPVVDLDASGPLMGYGADAPAIGNQVARLADQILKGTDATEVPVEDAQYFMTLNLTAAEAIDFEIPEKLLEQADNIIRETA